MGWVNERLEDANCSPTLTPKFLALKGSSVCVFSSPPREHAGLGMCRKDLQPLGGAVQSPRVLAPRGLPAASPPVPGPPGPRAAQLQRPGRPRPEPPLHRGARQRAGRVGGVLPESHLLGGVEGRVQDLPVQPAGRRTALRRGLRLRIHLLRPQDADHPLEL